MTPEQYMNALRTLASLFILYAATVSAYSYFKVIVEAYEQDTKPAKSDIHFILVLLAVHSSAYAFAIGLLIHGASQ